MALSFSNLYTSPLISHSPISPAKRRSSDCPFILCTPFFILHPQSPLSSFSSSSIFSVKPIYSNLRTAAQLKNVYPDPIPEFAKSETQKFRVELMKKLSKSKDTFGDDLDTVVKVCAEIFSDFLHKEYGGPGTLLVEPFTDMLVALKVKKLPGAPVAARAALLWAQNYVDQDWEVWTSQPPK